MTKLSEISSDSVDEISEHDNIRKYCKQMLKSSLFIGTFQEKRFVESLNAYRDVISVSREENDFIKNLMVVKKKIDEGFLKKPWVGITEPETIGAPVGHSLWVELKVEVFGKYWYKVRTVEFLQNEIRVKLDIIRPATSEPFASNTPKLGANEVASTNSFGFKATLEEIPVAFKLYLVYFCTTILTFDNVKHSVIFLSLLIGTIITGGVNIVKFLLEYLLKLLREFSGLIKAVTPITITCLNLIGKSIQGFYFLILSMWRGKPQLQPQPMYNNYIYYDPQADPRQMYNMVEGNQWNDRFARRLTYPPNARYRSGPTITPLDD